MVKYIFQFRLNSWKTIFTNSSLALRIQELESLKKKLIASSNPSLNSTAPQAAYMVEQD